MGLLVSCYPKEDELKKERELVKERLDTLRKQIEIYDKKIKFQTEQITQLESSIRGQKLTTYTEKKKTVFQARKLQMMKQTLEQHIKIALLLFRFELVLKTTWENKITAKFLSEYVAYAKSLKPENSVNDIDEIHDQIFDLHTICEQYNQTIEQINSISVNTEPEDIEYSEIELSLSSQQLQKNTKNEEKTNLSRIYEIQYPETSQTQKIKKNANPLPE